MNKLKIIKYISLNFQEELLDQQTKELKFAKKQVFFISLFNK